MTTAMDFSVRPPFSMAPDMVMDALPLAICVLDEGNVIRQTYGQAELFFGTSNSLLVGKPFDDAWMSDGEVFELIKEVRRQGAAFTVYDVEGRTRGGGKTAEVHVAPFAGQSDWIVLVFDERSASRSMTDRTLQENAARSMTALAMTLAHEIKNPLSGIRGAAQLLEQSATEEDRSLTALICAEADRIVALINRMEVFSDERPLVREAVNIHYVLDHVKKIAENGFARHMKIIENYDPSLPPVWGNRDALIQVFLNLVKNAAEAATGPDGQLTITTTYCREMKLSVPDEKGRPRYHIPITVSIADNGENEIPEDLRPNLFDPFITTKASGSGLGLPLVAKLVRSHGGMVEFDSWPGRTVFQVLLPLVNAECLSRTERQDADDAMMEHS